MLLRFTKMHGLGNDFVVVDLITQRFSLQEKHIRKLADRHFGIGCDQVLVVETPSRPDVDFRYRIYNGDGNEVEQCGNGARCFAKYVFDKKLTGKKRIKVETNTGILELSFTDNNQVRVNMGKPLLDPETIPFQADARAAVVLDEARYLEAARKNAHFLLTEMRREDGSFYRTRRNGRSHLDAYLEDYAFVTQGLLDLFEADGDPRWLKAAQEIQRNDARRAWPWATEAWLTVTAAR